MIRVLASALALTAFPALADPCEAPVGGYKPGTVVVGRIRYVGDGDSFCVGQSADPASWVEIRLADWFAPELNEPGGREAKRALDRLQGQRATCVATRGHNGSTRSYDRLVATCTVNGRPIAEHMSRAGVEQGGRGR